jgi:hypothetical protein
LIEEIIPTGCHVRQPDGMTMGRIRVRRNSGAWADDLLEDEEVPLLQMEAAPRPRPFVFILCLHSFAARHGRR